MEGDIWLLQNRKEQSRLDDWKEFQYWEHKKADGLVKKMEQAAEAEKLSETRLQAAIDAEQPADRIEWIKEQGVARHEARRGTAGIELRRQAVLLKWIAEQLPMIAAECRTSGFRSAAQDTRRSNLISTNLGKRKRSMEDPAQIKDSRRKVEFADHPSPTLSPVINTNSRASTIKALPQRKAAPISRTGKHQRRKATHQETHDLSTRHGSKVSTPSQKKPSPKPANSSRVFRHAKRGPIQTPFNQVSHQAEPKTSVLAVVDASERGLLHQAHPSQVSKAQTRDGKARGGKVKLNSSGNKERSNSRPQSRQDEALGKISTSCKSIVPRARTKRSLASNPVRRSQRISQRPTVHYF